MFVDLFTFCARVQDLNWTISTLSENVKEDVHNHIIQALKGKERSLNGND